MNYNENTKNTELESIQTFGTVITKALVILTLFVVLLQTVGVGQAANEFALLDESCFSYPSTAMSAYDTSIQKNLYRKTHARVYHQAAATGTILLYGPADKIRNGATGFQVTFKDPDGPGFNSRVVAKLRHIGPGGIKTIKTLDSNTNSRVTNEIQTMKATFFTPSTHRTSGFYEVRIYIYRSTTDLSPSAFGYSFCNVIL